VPGRADAVTHGFGDTGKVIVCHSVPAARSRVTPHAAATETLASTIA